MVFFWWRFYTFYRNSYNTVDCMTNILVLQGSKGLPSPTGAAEATFHLSGHIREIAKGSSKFSRFLTSIDKISLPGLTVKIQLQIMRTLLHKIIHIIL